MSGYFLIKTKITDPEQYQKYVEALPPLKAQFDSEFILKARPIEALEGDFEEWGDYLILVSKFPDLETARRYWNSDAYQDIKKLREGAGEVHICLADDLG